jgi:hypothetical protein
MTLSIERPIVRAPFRTTVTTETLGGFMLVPSSDLGGDRE